MSIRGMLAYSALAVGMCVATNAQAAEYTAKDAAAIRKVFDDAAAYARAANWTAWATLYAEDAVLQPPNAPSVKGRAAIQAWAQAFPAIESLTLTNVQVWGEGSVAFTTNTYMLKLKGAPADNGKELHVFRRSSAGKWEVVAASFNSDLPTPGPTQPVARKK